MDSVKIRIAKKEKDGVTLKVKGTPSVKISWDEFNAAYTIENNVWAVMKPDFKEKMDKLQEYISEAAVEFIMQDSMSISSQDKFTHMLMMQHNIEKIQELTKCSTLDAIQLVKQRVNAIRNEFGVGSRRWKKRQTQPEAPNVPMTHDVGGTTSAVMSDNPALLKLKESMAE